MPIVVLLAVKSRRSVALAWAALAALVIAGIATRTVLWMQTGTIASGRVDDYYSLVYYSSFCRMDEFLPGVAVALLKNCHRGAWARLMRFGNVMLAAGLVAVGAVFWLLESSYWRNALHDVARPALSEQLSLQFTPGRASAFRHHRRVALLPAISWRQHLRTHTESR